MGKDSKGHGSNPHSSWSDEKLRTHFDRYAQMKSPTDAHMDKMEAIGDELEARKKLAHQQPSAPKAASSGGPKPDLYQGAPSSVMRRHNAQNRDGMVALSKVRSTMKNRKY